MDGVWRWTFENTEVGTEYLSGSNQHSNDLQKGECKRVVWTPLTEDARLQVNVRESGNYDNTGINRNRYEEIKYDTNY